MIRMKKKNRRRRTVSKMVPWRVRPRREGRVEVEEKVVVGVPGPAVAKGVCVMRGMSSAVVSLVCLLVVRPWYVFVFCVSGSFW